MNSFSDTLIYALIVTLFGMGIVFIVLVLLQYILKTMKVIFYRDGKKQDKTAPAAVEEKVVEAVKTENIEEAETADDEELVAVITAAIASSLGRNSNIVVRSIRRVNDMTPVWGKAGRSEQMANRF